MYSRLVFLRRLNCSLGSVGGLGPSPAWFILFYSFIHGANYDDLDCSSYIVYSRRCMMSDKSLKWEDGDLTPFYLAWWQRIHILILLKGQSYLYIRLFKEDLNGFKGTVKQTVFFLKYSAKTVLHMLAPSYIVGNNKYCCIKKGKCYVSKWMLYLWWWCRENTITRVTGEQNTEKYYSLHISYLMNPSIM